MKVVVKLAIAIATLLLVTNMAFAFDNCQGQELCYDVTYTDNQGNVVWQDTLWVDLCNDGTGELYAYLSDFNCSLYLFGGGTGWFNASGAPALGGKPNWSTWLATKCTTDTALVLQPIGEGYLLTGVDEYHSDRSTVTGKRVSMSNCPK